jgi:hypothetical protein
MVRRPIEAQHPILLEGRRSTAQATQPTTAITGGPVKPPGVARLASRALANHAGGFAHGDRLVICLSRDSLCALMPRAFFARRTLAQEKPFAAAADLTSLEATGPAARISRRKPFSSSSGISHHHSPLRGRRQGAHCGRFAGGVLVRLANGGLIRQILGAVSQFEKALVSKLRGARERKNRLTGKCEGNPGHAERQPEKVALALELRRERRAERASLRDIAAELMARGHIADGGKPFWSSVIARMVERAR